MRTGVRYKADGTETYYLDGKVVTEAAFRAACPDRSLEGGSFGGTPPSGWPIYSDALGVHPSQVAEHERVSAEKGVPTACLPDGRVVLTDRAHRKRYLKAFGFHDRSGGYGD